MKGIEYVIDEAGNRKAVLIDLELHEALWGSWISCSPRIGSASRAKVSKK